MKLLFVMACGRFGGHLHLNGISAFLELFFETLLGGQKLLLELFLRLLQHWMIGRQATMEGDIVWTLLKLFNHC